MEVVTRSLFVYSLGTLASPPSPSLASVDIRIHLKSLYARRDPGPQPWSPFSGCLTDIYPSSPASAGFWSSQPLSISIS